MARSGFNPQRFFQQAENVALHVPASELFGLLTRSLDLPSPWAALVKRDAGEYTIVPAGDTLDGVEAEDILFIRVTPVEILLTEEGIATHDRFQCQAKLRLRLGVIPERGELQSFLKVVVGSHRVVQVADVARYLQPTILPALVRFAADHEAASLVNGSVSQAVAEVVAESLQAPLFAAGLVLDAPPSVRFDSATLRQVQQTQQEAARRQAEHDAARPVQQALDRAQSEHLNHLASLLARLKRLAADSPHGELADLIRTFTEQERGELYEALFASEPAETPTQWVVVAAGDELLFFEPSTLETPTRRFIISGAAGPVRSIQVTQGLDGRFVLLLGAATGVYRLPVDHAEPDRTWLVEGSPSVRGGFNAVALAGDRLFASHSALGLYEWNISEPASATPRFQSLTQSANAVRGVQFFEGSLYCSIDDRVIGWPADATEDQPTQVYTGSGAAVTALCPTSDGLWAGNDRGEILRWEVACETKPERFHLGTQRAAESVWILATHGIRRLVYTDTSPYVHMRVLGDHFTCRYEASGQTLRRVEIASDLLVATNDLRDRLIVWTPGHPARPSATVGVSRITGHSVQDVCLVPRVERT